MKFHTIIFDLDDTLYPSSNGVWEAISLRIDEYMTLKLNLEPRLVPGLRKELFVNYGTTLRGLKILYGIDEEEYLDFVHDIPVHRYIQINPQLIAILEHCKQTKVVFTNSDIKHSMRVLTALGVEKHFSEIIDIHSIQPYCKPMPEAFKIALQIIGMKTGNGCIFVDDTHKNLLTAAKLGFFTIKIGNSSHDGVDAMINRIEDLPGVLPMDNGK